ncbi:carboxy methyl transferase for protein phosphatase 2A [Cladophialophora chaetospira]|uniref:Leucine carboxyl methyltransferase 1 n=1 Tax=Cladophialophora chaetospira TaxID=386627 RepID=A0AA38TXD0_9EURO|nr:carboxy methyl transferase for protein phosphatase 2A [Cladophialophora chaetospira]
MSAPLIPNLNSLRRGGLRGRGRGQAMGSSNGGGPDSHQKKVNHDLIVQQTDHDAATSRQSAVDAGYLEDPFTALLHEGDPVSRRLPLMNRGTYIRTMGIDRVVDTFLLAAGDGRRQIISLGAGSDTRYFRLKQKRRKLDVVYHELDFEANTRRKIAKMRGHAFSATAKTRTGVDTRAEEVELSQNEAALVSPNYIIHPQDLRDLPRREAPLSGIDKTLPTLIISECCLVYLPPDDADAVLRYFSGLFADTTPLAIVVYEPIRPHDPFGKTMISNLANRGLQLQTLEKYHDPVQQTARLNSYGFGPRQLQSGDDGLAADIDFVWRRWISAHEKERVEGLEWMDEVEEFVLLAKHYCIAWGWRGFALESPWEDLPRPSG